MKIPKNISFLSIVISSTLSLTADELKFKNIEYDQFKENQSIYEPKDKLEEYIIRGVTYSTKFVPLINDGAVVSPSSLRTLVANSLSTAFVSHGSSNDGVVVSQIAASVPNANELLNK